MHFAYSAAFYAKSQTSLMKAANNNNITEIKRLLEEKADVTQTDMLGNTALKHAIWKKHPECIALLRNAHVKQFYHSAKQAAPGQLDMLLEKHTEDALITQEIVATYLFEEVKNESDPEQQIVILAAAIPSIQSTALSAYMNIRNCFGQRTMLSQIEKIRNELLPEGSQPGHGMPLLPLKPK